MTNLIKISDVAEKYGVTTRTLRFYETAGLIRSQRTDAYAYRMYDETALKRLEQILILRRMSISVKDIKRIFESAGSEVVLDVLDGKAKDIDEEVALLHELKGIVLKFIRQIKQADFSKEADIQLLYEQAEKIEEQIDDEDLARLAEVSEKLGLAAEVRVSKFELFVLEGVILEIFASMDYPGNSEEAITSGKALIMDSIRDMANGEHPFADTGISVEGKTIEEYARERGYKI